MYTITSDAMGLSRRLICRYLPHCRSTVRVVLLRIGAFINSRRFTFFEFGLECLQHGMHDSASRTVCDWTMSCHCHCQCASLLTCYWQCHQHSHPQNPSSALQEYLHHSHHWSNHTAHPESSDSVECCVRTVKQGHQNHMTANLPAATEYEQVRGCLMLTPVFARISSSWTSSRPTSNGLPDSE
jgi:hypothetical protein